MLRDRLYQKFVLSSNFHSRTSSNSQKKTLHSMNQPCYLYLYTEKIKASFIRAASTKGPSNFDVSVQAKMLSRDAFFTKSFPSVLF